VGISPGNASQAAVTTSFSAATLATSPQAVMVKTTFFFVQCVSDDRGSDANGFSLL
jgi:hypothetical protein